MALAKGTRRYQNRMTQEIRYFKNEPDPVKWSKIGTTGSKKWKWITNGLTEEYIGPQDPIPGGFYPGRKK